MLNRLCVSCFCKMQNSEDLFSLGSWHCCVLFASAASPMECKVNLKGNLPLELINAPRIGSPSLPFEDGLSFGVRNLPFNLYVESSIAISSYLNYFSLPFKNMNHLLRLSVAIKSWMSPQSLCVEGLIPRLWYSY